MSSGGFKKLILFVVPFLSFFVFAIVSSFLEEDDIKINSYHADIYLNEFGDMRVIETWDMHYDGDYNVRFRDIGYTKSVYDAPLVSSDSNVASFDEDAVAIKVSKNGTDVTNQVYIGYSFQNDRDELGDIITCDPYSIRCESLFVDFNMVDGMDGDIVFEYDYTILGAMTSYPDSSELNWKLFSYMEADIEEVVLTINVPANTYDVDDFYLFFHGREDVMIHKISNTQFTLSLDYLSQDAFLEFRLLTPKALFYQIPLENRVSDPKMTLDLLLQHEDDISDYYQTGTKIRSILHTNMYTLGFIVVFLGVIAYVLYDKERPKTYQDKYLSDLPSDDTPAEVGYLIRMKRTDDVDLTATVLDLVRRGYIAVDNYGNTNASDFTLERVTSKSTIDLLPHEKTVMTWFFDHIGHGNRVSTGQIQTYGKQGINEANLFQSDAKAFVRAVKESANSRDYFEGYKYNYGKKVMIGLTLIPILYGVVATILGIHYQIDFTLPFIMSFVLAIVYFIYVIGIKRRSRNGHELYQKWMAFKAYLEDFDGLKQFSFSSINTWDHQLVYATTFKLADKVMNQMKVNLPKSDKENSSNQGVYSGYHSLYYGFNRSYRTGRNNTNRTISAHRSSSSGGGSFGGGGGGGGGRSR